MAPSDSGDSSAVPATNPPSPPVAIVLLNWNGWEDTILCLQSLFGQRYPSYRVLVCDNGSADASVARIEAWARGELCAWVPPTHPARALVDEPPGPVPFATYEGGERVAGTAARPGDERLTILRIGTNLGFAGGNNVGVRHALERGDVEYLWVLNNDTAVERDALACLVDGVRADGTAVLASSRVVSMADPDTAWFEGGEFRPVTATAMHVSTERFAASRHAFLSGCALLVGRDAVARIGMLDDSFFLYGEDIDYSIRARRAQLPLRVVRDSVVLHAGSAANVAGSPRAYRLYVSGAVRVALRHHGRGLLATIVPYHLARAAAMGVVRRPRGAVIRAYLAGLREGVTLR